MAQVNLSSSGLPETVLDEEPAEARARLASALSLPDAAERRSAVAEVVADYPRYLEGWARLGDLGRDPMESYAAYRVGYHRGLDRLRQNGWRGSGFVRAEHSSNRGFLRALNGLRRLADQIGENDEAERCAVFLSQLDPQWSEADLED